MNAYLLLANGMVFAGQSVGAEGVTVGEVVFATGMVGFQETLTDPSYYGQIITQTYPLIGNYGMNKDDMESDRIWACLLYTSCLQEAPDGQAEPAGREHPRDVQGRGSRRCGRHQPDQHLSLIHIFDKLLEALKIYIIALLRLEEIDF